MNDSIPVNQLGPGILMIERIGLSPEPYHGYYFVDLETNDRWAFGFSGSFAPQLRKDAAAVMFSLLEDPYSGYNVFISDLFGNTLFRLTGMSGDERFPVWDPNGNYFYFWSYQILPPILYIQLASSTLLNRYPVFQAGMRVNGDIVPLFPSGRVGVSTTGQILFACNQAPADSLKGIYLVEVESGVFEKIYHPDSTRMVESPVFDLAEANIIFSEIERDTSYYFHSMRILSLNIKTKQINTLWESTLNAQNEWRFDGKDNSIFLSLSPDGQWIFFNKPEVDLVSHIYALKSDGSLLIQVTNADSVADYSVSMGIKPSQ